jgi:hypothetical protein
MALGAIMILSGYLTAQYYFSSARTGPEPLELEAALLFLFDLVLVLLSHARCRPRGCDKLRAMKIITSG